MGLGASLAFIAIGAILAFALRVELSGIDIQMVGWILILVGVVGLAFTLMYTRPRTRDALSDVVEEEPLYVVHPEEPATTHVHEHHVEQAVPPHVHPDGAAAPAQPVQQEPVQPVDPGDTTGPTRDRRAPHERL